MHPLHRLVPPSLQSHARSAALVVVLALGIFVLASQFHEHYPIHRWLFWRYATYWLVMGAFGASCLLVGSSWLRLLRIQLPRWERVVFAFGLGLFTFFLVMFVAGIARVYSSAFAVLLPICMFGIALALNLRRFRRVLRVRVSALRGPVRIPSVLSTVVGLAGLLGLFLVYVPILTPHNTAADARWYHLTLAQHFAANGITAFPEGSFVGAYPQMSTVLYAWAFLLPRATIFDKIEIAAHMEFVIFLFTLVGVSVLAARLLHRRQPSHAWVAMFLFPGIFLYDSSLSAAADHNLAFWGPLIFLGLLRAWKSLAPIPCILLSIALAGAALTKYQSGTLVLVPVLAVSVRAVWLSARAGGLKPALRTWTGPLLAAAGLLLLTSPHWLKNAVWYHDPFYPLLHKHLPSRPWTADAALYKETLFQDNLWRPTGTLFERLKETFLALFTFSFKNHDWSAFHGKVPVFGSLFTLTSLCVPLLKRNRRLLGLTACTYGGLFVWYWGSHQDRYLQALLPWMAGCTAAVIMHLWSSGLVVQTLTAALIGIQVVWGGDVPFLPAHAFLKAPPYKAVIDLMASGFHKDYKNRLHPFSPWPEITDALPKNAKVLIHEDLGPLGLQRAMVTDMVGWQGGISYGRYGTPRNMHEALRKMGVTHLVWEPDWTRGQSSLADDLMFYDFALQYTENIRSFRRYRLARLPDEPPPASTAGRVLVWQQTGAYAAGIYHLDQLTVPGYKAERYRHPPPLQTAGDNVDQLVTDARYVIVATGAAQRNALRDFTLVMQRWNLLLYARKVPGNQREAADGKAHGKVRP